MKEWPSHPGWTLDPVRSTAKAAVWTRDKGGAEIAYDAKGSYRPYRLVMEDQSRSNFSDLRSAAWMADQLLRSEVARRGFARRGLCPPSPERDAEIIAYVAGGATYAQAARKFDLSRERIRQIVAKARQSARKSQQGHSKQSGTLGR